MLSKNDGLLPCPFCGNEDVYAENCEYNKALWTIRCGRCHMEMTAGRTHDDGRGRNNRDEAVRVWNTRAVPEAKDRDEWKRMAEAAIAELKLDSNCATCRHNNRPFCMADQCDEESCGWEWRGVCAENCDGVKE